MTTIAYTTEIGAKFCTAAAEDDTSIRAICKLPGMRSKASVFRWLAENEDFQKLYEQAEAHVDEVVELADIARASKTGAAKAKLQIYASLKLTQRMKPRK